MAYVEKRKQSSGVVTYRVRIRQKGAPALSSSFRTRREAVEWAQRMEAEVRAGRYFGREEGREKTFAEFIDRYIQNELPKNPKAYRKQKQLLSWWKSHLGQYFLCRITPSAIAELRDLLMTEQTPKGTLRTSSTANRYIAALSRAFTICQREWCWVRENPVLKITRPRENKPRERFLDKDEIAHLLEVCKKSRSQYLYGIVLFALSTGARKGEILSLTWSDIDFARMTATFRETKNGETRSVHLSSTIIGHLREEREKRAVPSVYVFPNHDGTKPADIKTAWENAMKEAGLQNVCFHSLRHTAASHLCMGGFSPLEIAAVLGHKTLAMVKRYSHLSFSATARALDRLNDEIFGDVVNG